MCFPEKMRNSMGRHLRWIKPKPKKGVVIMYVPPKNANKNLPKKALSAASVKGHNI